VRDSIEMDWAGIPAVAVVHEALSGSADAMASISHMPGYGYVMVRFPVQPTGIWTEPECDAIADELVPAIVSQLTGRP
jgi:hypothetical protein